MRGELTKSINEIHSPSMENYTKIHPETEMTAREVQEFWKGEFTEESRNAYTKIDSTTGIDDNGVRFREGTDLLPNVSFEVNGYTYRTDSHGRIISAEGKLQLKNHEGRSEMAPRSSVDKGDMKETDERGHLIADMFNGSGGIENLAPMDAQLNKGDYKKMEHKLYDALKNGADVWLKIEPIYEKGSHRPTEFKAVYTMDGEKEIEIFRNGGQDT